jgi:hypothetical protein
MLMGRTVWADPAGQTDDGSVDALTVRTAGTLAGVKLVGQTTPTLITSTSYTTLISAAITIPAGQTNLVVAEFAAEVQCFGAAAYWCTVNMRADPTDMWPDFGTNTDFAFDTVGTGGGYGDYYETHSMTRFICLSGGTSGKTYRIYVDAAVLAEGVGFSLDSWTLKIERYNGCAYS